MLARLPKTKRRRTVAGDKGYDTKGFVAGVRQLGFTPHVAQNTSRQRSAIDGRTTRHPGHALSMRIRKRVEEPFGWIKTIGGGRHSATEAATATKTPTRTVMRTGVPCLPVLAMALGSRPSRDME